ncbi:hypothetical protein SHKM778_42200 [Streptomyces sp. KM77-8]|uniref:Glutamate--cysteine ligase n=1 Tax=Streptomyces haneummycinicus TaxID=3074435 RepID=A0AAT9HK85_9ACTN
MGRDVPALTFTREDRRRYRIKMQECLDTFAQMLRESRFEAERPQVGLEIELNLVDDRAEPAMRNTDVLEAIADPAWDTELGRFNLEINIPPRRLIAGGPDSWESEIRAALNHAEERARSTDARLIMTGILPTLRQEDVGAGALSENPRYQLLNDQIFAARGEDLRIEVTGIDRLRTYADSITPEAACTSTQFHLQVSPEQFAGYWNAAQAIAGVQVALAANSPSCSARSCGTRPGSRCSSRPPTPARRRSRCRAYGPGCGSGSAGSPASSTSSRRTCATSRPCSRCATSRTPRRPWSAATSPNSGS